MFSCYSMIAFSQQQVRISNLRPQSENFIFPLISYKGKPTVEKKINTFLQVDELEFIPNSGKNPYQLASTATNSYQNFLYFYGWKRVSTPKNILSIEIEGEASGAYPERFTNYKNFDLRTGNFINLEDLFQPNSFSQIEKIINNKIKKRVTDYIAELRFSKNKEEDSEDRIAMYEGCFTEYSLPYLKYYFEKNKLTVVAGRCSNHALLALDDLGSHEIVFNFKDLNQFWSPFAKNLISNSEVAISQATFQNKLYKGKIAGKFPIILLIKRTYDDGAFSAVYWYEKSKKIIEWDGSLKNKHISATENDYYDEELKQWIPRAKIEAHLEKNKIIGTWQDYKTKNNFKLELEEL